MEKKIIKFENLPIEQVAKKTDLIWVEQTQLRGGIFNTVEIGYVEFELHRRFPLWDFEIVEDKQIDGQIVVKGKLTVKSPDGKMTITKMQYGSSEVKKFADLLPNGQKNPKAGEMIDLANDYKAAASDALKKCASLLGIAFDVYHPRVWQKLFILAKRQNKNVESKEEKNKEKIIKLEKELAPQTEGMKRAKEAMEKYKTETLDEDPISPPNY